MITVKKLIEILKTYPEDAPIICQRDSEGNGFSPLSEASFAQNYGYVAESTWSGYAMFTKLDEDLIKDGYSEDDLDPDAIPAVFLLPVN